MIRFVYLIYWACNLYQVILGLALPTYIDIHQRKHFVQRQTSCGRPTIFRNNETMPDKRELQSDIAPWFVALMNSSSLNQFICSGILITDQYVLTGARCVDDVHRVEELYILVGAYYKNNGKVDIFQVDGFIIHDEFYANSEKNNLAIIKLKNRVNFSNPRHATICLPQALKTIRTTGWKYKPEFNARLSKSNKIHVSYAFQHKICETIRIDSNSEICRASENDETICYGKR